MIKRFIAVLLLLALVGGVGYFSVSYLKRNARMIVDDTLPSLTYAAAANTTLAAAYNNLLLFLTSNDADERTRFRHAVNEISDETTKNLNHYSRSIFDAEDQRNFDTLVKQREKYLGIRRDVMNLAENGQQAEALRKFKEELKPAFEAYHAAGENLLSHTIQVGSDRGREITTICNLTQVLVAFIGVLLFVTGFLFGLFR